MDIKSRFVRLQYKELKSLCAFVWTELSRDFFFNLYPSDILLSQDNWVQNRLHISFHIIEIIVIIIEITVMIARKTRDIGRDKTILAGEIPRISWFNPKKYKRHIFLLHLIE